MTTGRQRKSLRYISKRGAFEVRTTKVVERGGDIARALGPQSNGSSPIVWVRVTVLDVLRDLGSVEPPDGNVRLVPNGSEDTTGIQVEGSTSTSFGVGEGATIIVTGRTLALGRERSSKEGLSGGAVSARIDGLDVRVRFADTLGTGMEGVLVGHDIVDTLDYVDLKE